MQPTMQQLVEAREAYKTQLATLKKAYEAQAKELEDVIDGFDEMLLGMFQDGEVTRTVALTDGAKVTVTRGVNSQFRINEGESETFYQWARANGRTDLLQRRISQDAMTTEVQTNGLPPGVFVHTEPKLNFTKRRAAPDVA